MKILFISDVKTWDNFSKVFDSFKPDLVLMGGDLVSDGVANFWRYSDLVLLNVPAFREKILGFLERYEETLTSRKNGKYEKAVEYLNGKKFCEVFLDKKSKCPHHRLWPLSPIINAIPRDTDIYYKFYDLYFKLEREARKTEVFRNYVDNHVSAFYRALEYSSKNNSTVFVVMGDHDLKDFSNAYDIKRINSFENVQEISGKSVDYKNLRILGLGFIETHYPNKLRNISSSIKGNIDVILTHSEQSSLLNIARWIKPKIIVRGHFGVGVSRILDVLVLESGVFPTSFIMIELKNGLIKNLDIRFYCDKSENLEKCTKSCSHSSGNIKVRKSKWPWQQIIYETCPLEAS